MTGGLTRALAGFAATFPGMRMPISQSRSRSAWTGALQTGTARLAGAINAVRQDKNISAPSRGLTLSEQFPSVR